MTQPEQAVEGTEPDTVLIDEPTIEDRFAALANDPEPEQDEDPPADTEADPVEDEAPEDPPAEVVAAPVSWTDAEKAEFAQLPTEVQKTISRREAEREKFVQAKSQEASKVAQQVQQQAVEQLGQLQANYAQQLAQLLPQVPEKPPAHLMATDPRTYAARLEAHEYAQAQHNQIVQQMQQVVSQQQAIQQQLEQQQKQQLVQELQTQFPEYLSPDGAELRQSLTSTALALGYPAETLARADAQDILAMRTAHEWKVKAEKYDALQADKMGQVRAAKLPSVSRPGAAQPKGAAARERYTADRKAMRAGDKDAAARVFKQFL